MSDLGDNYKRIITEIEQKVSNEEELEFVKKKILELSGLFMNTIDKIIQKKDSKLMHMEKRQQLLDKKITEIQSSINEIEDDIYIEEQVEEDEEDSFDFEIVCPYCNQEFIAEISGKNEIECPKCHNMIELDWEEEEETTGCMGSCQRCSGCESNLPEEETEQEDKDDDM